MTRIEHDAIARSDLRAQALAATYRWRDAVVEELDALVTAAGVTGKHRLVVMRANLAVDAADFDAADDGDYVDLKENLESVDLAGTNGVMTVTAAAGSPLWVELVRVWDELREATGHSIGSFIPVNLVIDLGSRLLGVYDAAYCPDNGGPIPDILLDLKLPAPGSSDPFEELLASVNLTDGDNLEGRLETMLYTHNLTAPGVPAHAPGECGDDEADDD